MQNIINFTKIESEKDFHKENYTAGTPFPLLIIDDFLCNSYSKILDLDVLISHQQSKEKSSDFIFAKEKFETPDFERISNGMAQLYKELVGARFNDWLNYVVDSDVFIDAEFAGGGLHQGGEASYLDMHVDFSRHPKNQNWIRELNLLLYLNKNWKPSYGGSLDLQNKFTGVSRSIEPVANRMVIMLTKEHTLHGYKPISFPKGLYRTSIASYAYRMDHGSDQTPYRSTQWIPQSLNKRVWAFFSNRIVPIKQKVFGSRTASRAKR